ncbi:hypothetical protein [Phenylobacterium sp.]|jgi:hypothetical protein|uniref:hypothetical protein n=1 Tax=Phenylobacterium sp. TaxID=1871053 RepID=UPI002F41633B
MSTALERLTTAYYNSGEVSVANPGGLAGNGHVVNFPALCADVGTVFAGLQAAVDAIAGVTAAAAAAGASATAAAGSAAAAAASAATFVKATTAEIRAAANDTHFITPKGQADAALPQNLVDGATVPWDMGLGWNAEWTIGVTGRALLRPTSSHRGWTSILGVTQGAGGNKVPDFSAITIRWLGGVPEWSTAAAARDLVILTCTDETVGAPVYDGVFVRGS